jgi:carbonic anhydrase
MISAQQALDRLREGNRRFVADVGKPKARVSGGRRIELKLDQAPFATILGCSDSRVPAEIVFDQGLGDLFVIRVAGNIVAPSQVASVEFAASRFGTPLVVVLGHSRCGAIQATLEALEQAAHSESHHLKAIVDRVLPSVQPLFLTDLRHDRDALVREAVRANVRASVDQLRETVRYDGLMIVGAEYALETGVVDFFDYSTAPI